MTKLDPGLAKISTCMVLTIEFFNVTRTLSSIQTFVFVEISYHTSTGNIYFLSNALIYNHAMPSSMFKTSKLELDIY